MIPPNNSAGERITYALLTIQSLFSAATIMAFTVSSIIAVELAGGNEMWTGVPSTLTMIGAAGIAYPIGRLIDRMGYRFGLSVSYVIGFVGMIIAGVGLVVQSLALFLVGVLGLGLARGGTQLGRYAAGDANPPERRARAISIVVLGGTMGSIGGPALLNVATEIEAWLNWPEYSGAWLLGALCFVLAIIIARLFLYPDPKIIAQQFTNATSTNSPQGRTFWQVMEESPAARLAVAAMAFGQVVMVLVMSVTPVHMHSMAHELSAISFVIMAHTLGMFGLSFLTGWLIERLSAPAVIILGGVTLGVACVAGPLYDDVYWLAFSLFLIGLGWNFCYVAGSTMLSAELQPEEKGRIQGMVDAIVNLASGTGSLGGGFIYAAVGFWIMSWLALVASIPPVIQAMWFQRRAV